ncbi:MAG: outer membrane beta-barrel protein [Candidatus Eisenbacteria bacterium]|nr:outer membrane beta-barrel protein [Candidatus Latescibacterota bacterium]MBD3302603.1 outer membrane beta-barrel protein [Candidatus Eisenbacteria bacterium]
MRRQRPLSGGGTSPSQRGTLLSIAIGVAMLLAVPMPADSAGNYGPHLAYMKASDAEDGNFLVGGHLELRPAPIFGIQGAIDYRSTEEFTVGAGNEDHGLEIRSVPITVSGKLYVPTEQSFQPYALAGAGWYRVIYDYSEPFEAIFGIEDETVTTFGWHFGLGANVRMSEIVSLFGEARYAFVDPGKDLDEDVRDEIGEFDYDTMTLGAGLNIHF